MLVVKIETFKPFLSRKIEKGRELLPRLQEKSSSARFFLQPSVVF